MMSETKHTPESNNNGEAVEAVEAVETVIADSTAPDDVELPPVKDRTQSKGVKIGRVLVLLFAVIVFVLVTLATVKKLQPLFHKLMSSSGETQLAHTPPVLESRDQQPAAAVVTPPSAASKPVIAHDQEASVISHKTAAPVLPVRTADVQTAKEPGKLTESGKQVDTGKNAVANEIGKQTETSGVATPVEPAVASVGKVDFDRLKITIDALSGELALMRQSQAELKANLDQQQQMDMQVRIGWLLDPVISLPQIEQAWEEITLLPGLSVDQRNEANRMHALATRSARLVRQWREALVKWADMLVVPVHPEILPQPKQPWLAWIVGQFHVHKAPSEEARQLSGLRARLLNAARRLSLEEWPDKSSWQLLHAELLLQVQSIYRGKEAAMPRLGLPENLDALQHDIATLHATALSWKARKQGGV